MQDNAAPDSAGEPDSMAALSAAFADEIASNEPVKRQTQKQPQEPVAEEEPSAAEGDDSEAPDSEDGAPEESEEAEQEAPEETPDDTLIAVDIDGTEKQYTLKEAAKLIQRAEHYEKKTAALKNERESLERERSEIRAERQRYAEVIAQVESKLAQDAEFANVDWDRLAEEDPAEYTRLFHKKQKSEQALRAARQEQERLQQQEDQEYQARLQQYATAEAEKLLKVMPEFREKAAYERFEGYLVSQGFTREQIPAFLDHRVIAMIEDSRKFREAQKKGQSPVQTPKAPKIMRPGAQKSEVQRKNERLTAAAKRLEKTGSTQDLADFMIQSGFLR